VGLKLNGTSADTIKKNTGTKTDANVVVAVSSPEHMAKS
jgi:hypothetical protein